MSARGRGGRGRGRGRGRGTGSAVPDRPPSASMIASGSNIELKPSPLLWPEYEIKRAETIPEELKNQAKVSRELFSGYPKMVYFVPHQTLGKRTRNDSSLFDTITAEVKAGLLPKEIIGGASKAFAKRVKGISELADEILQVTEDDGKQEDDKTEGEGEEMEDVNLDDVDPEVEEDEEGYDIKFEAEDGGDEDSDGSSDDD